MKWIARPLAFILCTFLGVFAVTDTSTHGLRQAHVNVPDPVEQMETTKLRGEPQPAIAPNGIHVMYAGFVPGLSQGTSYLRIIVHNGGSTSLHYNAYESYSPFWNVLVNGSEMLPSWDCTMGAEAFYIPPGFAAEFRVYPNDFTHRPRTRNSVEVGFFLRQPGIDWSNIHYSEPLRLPLAFINSMD